MQVTPWNSRPIATPGVYEGVPIDVYHGANLCDGPSISSSGLRTIWSESPAHYWAGSALNPKRAPAADKPQFAVGRLAHKLLLEGRAGFEDEFAVRPEEWSDWRSKDAKMWREAMLAEGKTVVTPEDMELVVGMAESLRAHPLVKAPYRILDGMVEKSLVFRHAETGVWLKSRPDVIPNDSGDLVDLKTTVSVTTDALEKSLGSYGYQMQAALAAMALKATTGIEMQSFSFVWVEKAPPFCVRVTALRSEDLLRGAMQVDAAARIFADCLESGVWHGPGGTQSDAEYLALPSFAAKRIDDQLEVMKALQPYAHAAE